MAHSEVDSFVAKFKHLCHAGFRATLMIEAVDGEASISLNQIFDPLNLLMFQDIMASPFGERVLPMNAGKKGEKQQSQLLKK